MTTGGTLAALTGRVGVGVFSRQHYDAIAAAINYKRSVMVVVDAPTTASDVVSALADLFQEDNPRFDRARFFHACGLF